MNPRQRLGLQLAQKYYYETDHIMGMYAIIVEAEEMGVHPEFISALTQLMRSGVVAAMRDVMGDIYPAAIALAILEKSEQAKGGSNP